MCKYKNILKYFNEYPVIVTQEALISRASLASRLACFAFVIDIKEILGTSDQADIIMERVVLLACDAFGIVT